MKYLNKSPFSVPMSPRDQEVCSKCGQGKKVYVIIDKKKVCLDCLKTKEA